MGLPRTGLGVVIGCGVSPPLDVMQRGPRSRARIRYDLRRLRPNITISGVEGLSERTWEGSELRIGEALIGVVSLRHRCIMTTFDPDTAEQDAAVLEKIWRDFDGRIALDCEIHSPGIIPVGDRVELIPTSEAAESGD